MTVRFNDTEHEFLATLASYLCVQNKIDRPDKAAALRRILRMVAPPQDQTPMAKQLRTLHEKLIES